MSTKYSDFTRGEEEALLNTIGGADIARKILRGELKFSITEEAAKIIAAIKKLFDKNGRRIVPKGLGAAVCDPNKSYCVTQPKIDYKERMSKGFEGTGLNASMSLIDFASNADALINELKNSEQFKNLLKGTYLPIIIPKTQLTDLGTMTEELVTAAGKSYLKHFSNRSFTNYYKGELKEQITIIEDSRYDWLVEKIKQESVVGIYFPTVLQGYSTHAQREQMNSLPESFILSGPLDTSMGFAMYPDVLGRDEKTPVYDCSAVRWQSSSYSLSFSAHDVRASFLSGTDLSCTCDDYSGGLLFIKR